MRWFDFPGEDSDYCRQRAALLDAEIALRDQVERVAALRRQLPLGRRMPDYRFREGPADLARDDPAEFREIGLADLFTGGHDTLIVDHLMYGAGEHLEFFGHGADLPCPMCSLWADGYDAIAPHIARRAAFALVAKAEIGTLRPLGAAARLGHDPPPLLPRQLLQLRPRDGRDGRARRRG